MLSSVFKISSSCRQAGYALTYTLGRSLGATGWSGEVLQRLCHSHQQGPGRTGADR